MENKYEIGMLILRVVLGITFFVHGYVKFAGGIENTVGWFASIGLPGALAYGVAVIELVGGIVLFIGLGSRIVSALLALIMAGAIFTAKLSAGFLGNGTGAGWEFDLALLAMALVIALNGSKLLAVDQLFSKKQENTLTKSA